MPRDQLLGLRTVADHVSVIRSSQGPLGLAGCHAYVIAAARALVTHRREAAAASSASSSSSPASSGASSGSAAAPAAAEVPAASSLLRSRRLAEFLYETELRRCGRADKARATVRRLMASLLFWVPLPPPPLLPTSAPGEDGGVGGGAPPPVPRPPGYGKLPRPVAGHEKTALSQFQVWLSYETTVGLGSGGVGGGGEFAGQPFPPVVRPRTGAMPLQAPSLGRQGNVRKHHLRRKHGILFSPYI